MSERLAYLPEERRNKIRQGILALMPESVVFSFHQDNKLAGVIVLVDYTQHSTLNTLISWVWIKNRVDNNVKLFIKQKLVNVLIENSRENIIASVYTSNIRSLFFFTKLGFNLRWIYVE